MTAPNILKKHIRRLCADYFMPERLGEYEALLAKLKSLGYVSLTAAGYWQALKSGDLPPLGLILRHDVDTSPAIAGRQWEIESRLGLKSTFYFRWLTFEPRLMREIEASGGEVGYHYEEVADFAKRHHIHQAEAVRAEMETIKALFLENLTRFRSISGLPVRTVAAHGDFANRKLNLLNTVILENDPELRRRASILFEAYDQEVMAGVSRRLSDYSPPAFWRPCSPDEALADEPRLLYILLHSRYWSCRPYDNLRADLRRFWEGFRW
jgi:hypothetical protein